MLRRISIADKKANPKGTRGKKLKLISKTTGKVLGYGTPKSLLTLEKQIRSFKRKKK